MNGFLIIAHAPLASAFLQCVQHVFPDNAAGVLALDVQASAPPEETLAEARRLLAQLGTPTTLVLTDIFGATPCNVAQKLVDSAHTQLVTGLNLSMLLRAVCYRNEPLDALVVRALAGASQGVMQLTAAPAPPQTQRKNDQDPNDHLQ